MAESPITEICGSPIKYDQKALDNLIDSVDNRYAQDAISTAVTIVNSYSPEYANNAIKTIEKFKNDAEIASNIAHGIEELTRTDAKNLKIYLNALNDHEEFIKRKGYYGASGITSVFKKAVKNSPERLDEIVGIMKNYNHMFDRIDDFCALMNAYVFLGKTAIKTPEKVDVVANAFARNAEFINGFNTLAKKWKNQRGSSYADISHYISEYVVRRIGEAALNSPEKIDDVARSIQRLQNLIGRFDNGFIARDVVLEFAGPIRRCPIDRLDSMCGVFERYANDIKKYENMGDIPEIAIYLCNRVDVDNPDKLDKIIRAFEQNEDFVLKYCGPNEKTLEFVGKTAVESPGDMDAVVDFIKMYEPEIAGYVIKHLNTTLEETPEKIYAAVDVFTRYADFINAHSSNDLECFAKTVVYNPENADEVVKAFKQRDNFITKLEKATPKGADDSVDDVDIEEFFRGTINHYPERINDGLKALEQYENEILKQDISIRKNFANCIWHAGCHSPEKLEKVPGLTKKYDGETGVMIYRWLASQNDDKIGERIEMLDQYNALINSVAKEDLQTANKLIVNLQGIKECFGKYSMDIFDYFERRTPLHDINNVIEMTDDEALKKYLEKAMFESRLGNKKIKRILDVANVFAVAKECEMDLESEPQETPDKCYAALEAELVGKFKDRHGFDVSFDKLEKLSAYFPYLENKYIGDKIKQVMKGEKPESSLAAVDVVIAAERKQSIQNVREEMGRLAGIYKGLTGDDFKIKESEDIMYYNEAANKMLRQVKDWKRMNADRLDSVKPVLKELEPNLARIQNIREGRGKEYVVSFAPSDKESQLVALGKVTSCLSPGGCNFRYTAHYLGDMPEGSIFFATVKDSDRIVGRVTVAVGKDEKGNKRVARVSRMYPETLKISYKKLDSALSEYGKQIGAELLKSGKMEIEGVNGAAYDDKINESNVEGDMVVIDDKYNATSSA